VCMPHVCRSYWCLNSSGRFRPPNAIETREGGDICVSFDDNFSSVFMRSAALSSGPEKDGFTFDRVFPMGTKQHEVFDYGVKEYVHLF
jgi:kinesin family member 5